jgi:hypothetical protein
VVREVTDNVRPVSTDAHQAELGPPKVPRLLDVSERTWNTGNRVVSMAAGAGSIVALFAGTEGVAIGAAVGAVTAFALCRARYSPGRHLQAPTQHR